MITPQQRQAWKDEYLVGMRKVSKDIYPLEGRDESKEFGLDDRIILFYNDVLIPLINTTGYVSQNFPIVVSQIDEEYVQLKEEDRLPLPEVFDYLCTMSQYGRDIVLSEFPNYEPLLFAVQENDKERFLGIVQKQSLDFSDICLRVGYTNHLLLSIHRFLAYSMMTLLEMAIDEEEEKALEEEWKSMRERVKGGIGEAALNKLIVDERMTNLILKSTTLNIKSLDDVFQSLYSSFIPLWLNQCAIVAQHFQDDEFSIIKEMITNEEYRDIIEDIERLTYIVYGFPGLSLYEVNTKDLDEIKEQLQLN